MEEVANEAEVLLRGGERVVAVVEKDGDLLLWGILTELALVLHHLINITQISARGCS